MISQDLDKGTMLPYIKHIQSRGWGVVVTNTNHNEDPDTGAPIPGSQGPEQHAATVWDQLLAASAQAKERQAALRDIVDQERPGLTLTLTLTLTRTRNRKTP